MPTVCAVRFLLVVALLVAETIGQWRNYQKEYNLRFDPSVINRSMGDEAVPLRSNKLEDYVLERLSNGSGSDDLSRTNIMRPANSSGIAHVVQLLGSRLKTLLFASGATLIKAPHRAKGFLNLFEIIKFENSECLSSVHGIRTLSGVCYHEYECVSAGGVPMGTCASGVGVCCVFQSQCSNQTRQIVSYFQSPSYPSPVRDELVCVLTVELRRNVRQVRIDFLLFELNRPIGGNCVDDRFTVSGQSMNFAVPVLCGINTGQHIYIDVEDSKSRKLYVSVFGKSTNPRAFNFRVRQLEAHLAPAGCLQYHSEANGIIKSFNYEEDGSVIESKEASYFNNLNYAICIRRAAQMCSITYLNEVNNEEYVFQLTNKDEEENDINPRGQAGAGVINCPDDYVAVNNVRLCGDKLNDGSFEEDFTLNAIVKDPGRGPIVVPVRTDAATVGRGFKLIYYQELC